MRKEINAKFQSRCSACGSDIHPGDRITYDPAVKYSSQHKTCPTGAVRQNPKPKVKAGTLLNSPVIAQPQVSRLSDEAGGVERHGDPVSTLRITNHGPLIVATNYWDSELAITGKLFVSVNAGTIRILLPPASYGALSDMRAAKECVLSRGPWGRAEGIEILFDDESDQPFAMHLTPESFSLLPAEPVPGREWVLSVWTHKDGKPHKALERVCHWRRVDKIPWMRPWKEKP